MAIEVYINNEIRIRGNDSGLTSYLVNELTFPNPDYRTKVKLGKSVYNTPATINLYHYISGDLVVPYGMLSRIERYCTENKLAVRYMCGIGFNEDIAYPEVPLRDYQERAVEVLVKEHNGILESKAGSGKTQMGLALVSKLGKKTLWLTHTHDLLEQSKNRARQYFGDNLIGTISEGKVNIGKGITFATVQTMASLDLLLYRDEWDIVIVDECHRVVGSSTKVKQFQKVLENLNAYYKYGLSATMHRADGLIGTAYALIGDIIYTVPDEDVEPYLVPVSIKPVYTTTKIGTHSLNTDGTFNYGGLITDLITDEERNKLIISHLLYNSYNSNLILSDRLDHLHLLYAMLPEAYRTRSAIIDGSMTSKRQKELRARYLQDMREGKLNYLFATYKLAKEGLDIPALDRVYFATPQKDYAIVVQSVGRAMRKAEDKSSPIIYDFVDLNIPFLRNEFITRRRIYNREGYTIL